MKTATDLPWDFICESCGVPTSTSLRWIGRKRKGKSVIMVPGPKKKDTVDLAMLGKQIRALDHGPKRTRGSGGLYVHVKSKISRREFQAYVTEARREENRRRRAAYKHVSWNFPGVAWAIDDTELGRDLHSGRKVYLNTVFDPSARYTMESLIGYQATGPRIARHLRKLFKRYGPPLILKRDNGPNLNHEAVNAVLWEYMVIPLNSPPYFPRYNGGIERGQREIKGALYGDLGDRRCAMGILVERTEGAIYVVNHTPRAVLSGARPCELFHLPRERTFTERERHAIIASMADIAEVIYRDLDDQTTRGRETAQRLSVETWLKKEGLISVRQGNRVSPVFPAAHSHE
jgi:hypothetical protein